MMVCTFSARPGQPAGTGSAVCVTSDISSEGTVRPYEAPGRTPGEKAAVKLSAGGLKIVQGMKCFVRYPAFVMAFSLLTGLPVNLVV